MNALKIGLLAGFAALAASFGVAKADPYLYLTSAAISVYNVADGGGNSSGPLVNATPGAGSIFATPALYSGTYTGDVNFTAVGDPQNTVGYFLDSASGTLSAALTLAQAGTVLSTGGYKVTTGVAITFTSTNAGLISIAHDDGVSLYDITAGGGNILSPSTSPGPTVVADATGNLIYGHQYTLYYIEANGLPADLIATVPEPVSLSLLGAGLVGLGLVRRRKSRAA